MMQGILTFFLLSNANAVGALEPTQILISVISPSAFVMLTLNYVFIQLLLDVSNA